MEFALLLLAILVVLWLVWKFRPKRRPVCIVTLVKEPHQFQTWVDYHAKFIDRMYVFQDDPSEDLGVENEKLVLVKDWQDRLGYHKDPRLDEPLNWNRKQQLAFEEGQRMAERDGMEWIVHIDSDELLYGKDPAEVFARYPRARAFHFWNEEVAPEKFDHENCFKECTKFHGDPSRFMAYGNGKSAGRVGKCTWNGPHYFKEKSVEIPPEDLKVLHYPACNLEEFAKRKRRYGNFTEKSGTWSDKHKAMRDSDDLESLFAQRFPGPDAKEIRVM